MDSSIVHGIHWIVYIASFVAMVLLFTRYYRVGAVYLAVLFLSQWVFNGCIIVKWENYYRIKEGLLPLTNNLLTSQISSSHILQIILTLLIVLFSVIICLQK